MAAYEAYKEQFLAVLQNETITTVFQPIVSLRDGQTIGYEALSRGPKEMQNPEILFTSAKHFNKVWELEQLCRSKALEAAAAQQIQGKLFLNVNPNVMHDRKFRTGFTKAYLQNYDLQSENIVFEITEREAVDNITDFRKTVDHYKEQEYRIAIDDAGAGYSGLNMISDIKPHFIKLDMNLIRDIDRDTTKHSLVKSMCDFASMSNTLLIAEGIETEGELLKLIDLGVHYGQGYFIQRPQAMIQPITPTFIQIVQKANAKRNNMPGVRISDITIHSITTFLPAIQPAHLLDAVDAKLKQDVALPGFCITQDDNVIGVITRRRVHEKMSGQYGYSLFAKRSVRHIMAKQFLAVDYLMPIDVVAKKAMNRSVDELYDFITVTKEGKYLGIVTVKDLLEKTIQIERDNAKQLNPLTELPGNLLIERELEQCLYQQKSYAVLYFDLDNFKPFNDVYGFEKGDVVIKLVAKLLKMVVPSTAFIGHIGGDDFIVIMDAEEVQMVTTQFITLFDEAVYHLYHEQDQQRNYIVSKNRHGVEEVYPLLSVSIAGIIDTFFENTFEIAACASHLKKQCKQQKGSNYMSTTGVSLV